VTLLSDPAAAPDQAVAAAPAPSARRDARTRHGARRVRRALGWLVLALAIVALWPAQFGGLTGLTVVDGRSMEPTFAGGDLVISLRQPSYGVGDVVSYRIPEGETAAGSRVIHRIVSETSVEGETRYTSRGDSNAEPDAWAFGTRDILGRAVLRVPEAGAWFAPVGSPWLLALALGSVVTLLLWGDDREPRRPEADPEDDRR